MNTIRTFDSNRSPAAFWLLWVAATTIGLALGGLIGGGAGWGAAEAAQRAAGELAGYLVMGLFFGTALGGIPAAAQALVLGRRVHAGRWIGIATLSGVLAATAALVTIVPNGDNLPDWISGLLAGALLGLCVGIGQWWTIRRQMRRSAAWIGIYTASMALGLLILFGASGEGRELLALSSSGLVIGGLSGLGMLWLLRLN